MVERMVLGKYKYFQMDGIVQELINSYDDLIFDQSVK